MAVQAILAFVAFVAVAFVGAEAGRRWGVMVGRFRSTFVSD